MSHSSEHLESIPSVPSRLNPSKFAASPSSSPNRVLPQHVYPQAAPLQARPPAEGSAPFVGAYNMGPQENPRMQHEHPQPTWDGHQGPQSPFMNRTSSFGGWVDQNQNQQPPTVDHSLGNLGQTHLPNNQLSLIPETSERSSNDFIYSDTPRMSGRLLMHESAPPPFSLQPNQQMNGNAHETDWQHHASVAKVYQPSS